MRRWRVLDRGKVPEGARETVYRCDGCGREGLLPVLGTPIAQQGSGLIFEPGKYAIPALIECHYCRRSYGLEPERRAAQPAEACAS